jgi:hypothetical protein
MHCVLFKLSLVLHFVLLFRKLSVLKFLIVLAISALQAEIILPLDALQLLILCVQTLICLVLNSLLIIFYNGGLSVIRKNNYIHDKCVYIYIYIYIYIFTA